jgi:hypothetical protein
MTASSEFAVGLTHFFKGAPRLTAFRTKARGNAAHSFQSEQQRRMAIVEQLHRLHTTLMRNALASAPDVFALPPDSWLNEQLGKFGEDWRVQNVDGFRYEIYDAGSHAGQLGPVGGS